MNRSAILAILALLLLPACAPVIQQAARPEVGFAGPRLEDHAFIAADGASIALTRWLPQTPDGGPREPWAVIVGVHGMNDYSNAFHLAAPAWAADGIATYAYDQRGFGRSPGRGVWGGDALMTEDLRTLTALVRQAYPHAIIAVAGGCRMWPYPSDQAAIDDALRLSRAMSYKNAVADMDDAIRMNPSRSEIHNRASWIGSNRRRVIPLGDRSHASP